MSWRSLIISRPAKISLKNNQLRIAQEEILDVPLEDVSVLVLESQQILITEGLISKLCQNNTVIFVCDSKHIPNGYILPYYQHSRQLKVIKEQIALSEPFKKRIWQSIVKQKVKNQAYVLKCVGKHDAEEKLLKLSEKIDSGDTQNIEGQAAKIYFEELFHKGFSRNLNNIYNACLDYGYSILRGAIARTIVQYGYIPALGIHHKSELNNYNLADDFIEPFRPLVDLWVIQNVINEEEFSVTHRANLVDLLNYDVIVSRKRQSSLNAINVMISSFTTSIQKKDYQKILVPQIVPLERHIYG